MPETETCRRFRAAVELLADGEPMPGAAELQRHADACTACREELERARELARELRRLPAEICPPRVTAAVLARAAAAARPVPARPVPAPTPAPPARRRGRRRRSLARRTGWAPALAASAALLAGALLVLRPEPGPAPAMSAAELAEAEREVKLAFAYIGRVGRQAGDRMTAEVLDQVVQPTRRALGLTAEPRSHDQDP